MFGFFRRRAGSRATGSAPAAAATLGSQFWAIDPVALEGILDRLAELPPEALLMAPPSADPYRPPRVANPPPDAHLGIYPDEPEPVEDDEPEGDVPAPGPAEGNADVKAELVEGDSLRPKAHDEAEQTAQEAK